jgi:hypothetical protein
MDRSTLRFARVAVLYLAAGFCAAPVRADADEDAVRAAFTDFQKALKAGDADKIWPLLSEASQGEIDKTAKKLRDEYDKADAAGKTKLEKAFGLSAEEMAKVDGKLYVKSKKYLGKYDEVPTSKIDKVTIDGDKATVFYIEADGDKVQMAAVRKDGKWKLSPKLN